jgi:hypothetical protein
MLTCMYTYVMHTTGQPGFGMWNRFEATLSLYVAELVQAGRNLTLAFNVTNPPTTQLSPPIDIR